MKIQGIQTPCRRFNHSTSKMRSCGYNNRFFLLQNIPDEIVKTLLNLNGAARASDVVKCGRKTNRKLTKFSNQFNLETIASQRLGAKAKLNSLLNGMDVTSYCLRGAYIEH